MSSQRAPRNKPRAISWCCHRCGNSVSSSWVQAKAYFQADKMLRHTVIESVVDVFLHSLLIIGVIFCRIIIIALSDSKWYTSKCKDLHVRESPRRNSFISSLCTKQNSSRCFGHRSEPDPLANEGHPTYLTPRCMAWAMLVCLRCVVCCHPICSGHQSTTFGIYGLISRATYEGAQRRRIFTFCNDFSTPPSFCGAYLTLYHEKASAVRFPRPPCS